MSGPRGRRRDEAEFIDEVFMAVGNEYRRRVLYFLRQNGGVAGVDDLRRHLSERTDVGPETAATILHHAVLPRLDDVGMITYDRDAELIIYRGGSLETEVVDRVYDRERGGF